MTEVNISHNKRVYRGNCIVCGSTFVATSKTRKTCNNPSCIATYTKNKKYSRDVDGDDLYRRYIVDNMSLSALAKHYGVSRNTVIKWCRDFGIRKKEKRIKEDVKMIEIETAKVNEMKPFDSLKTDYKKKEKTVSKRKIQKAKEDARFFMQQLKNGSIKI